MMQKIAFRTIRYTALILSLGFIASCATITPEQLAAVEAKANNALSEARAANQNATAAHQHAEEAANAAAAAQGTADAARACCQGNTDKIDRMFRRAMSK